jgi:hypothetical protein
MNKELTPEKKATLEQQEQAKKAAEAKKAKKQNIINTTLVEKAKSLFKSFANTQTLYFTSDGMAFMSEGDAANHSHSLEDKTVQTINRN